MRLWTLHPKYLDMKGLGGAWREALLAQKVLEGGTRGYTKHPQLVRFRAHPNPIGAIATFLTAIVNEAKLRGYNYDATKINPARISNQIEETSGQLMYEWQHLLVKLQKRDMGRYEQFCMIKMPEVSSIFRVVPGEIQSWEKTELDAEGKVVMPGESEGRKRKLSSSRPSSANDGDGIVEDAKKTRKQTRTSVMKTTATPAAAKNRSSSTMRDRAAITDTGAKVTGAKATGRTAVSRGSVSQKLESEIGTIGSANGKANARGRKIESSSSEPAGVGEHRRRTKSAGRSIGRSNSQSSQDSAGTSSRRSRQAGVDSQQRKNVRLVKTQEKTQENDATNSKKRGKQSQDLGNGSDELRLTRSRISRLGHF